MIDLEPLKDAVARWETYRDRGIKPDICGRNCAMGDVAKHIGLDDWTDVNLGLRAEQGSRVMYLDNEKGVLGRTNNILQLITDYNDCYCEWPIELVKRLIQWEEASREAKHRVWNTPQTKNRSYETVSVKA